MYSRGVLQPCFVDEVPCSVLRCGVQVWIILELCTGGTLLDAALSGRFKLAGSDQQQQQQQPGTSRLEMVGATAVQRLLWSICFLGHGAAEL